MPSREVIRFTSLVSLCFLAGCVSAPPVVVEARHGTVYADSLERATEVARMLDEFQPAIYGLLGDAREGDVEVWVQKEPQAVWFFSPADGVSSFAIPHLRRIHLRDDVESFHYELAHELVHLDLGDSWLALPAALEEGLCDHIAFRLVPELSLAARVRRLIFALTATEYGRWHIRFEEDVNRWFRQITVGVPYRHLRGRERLSRAFYSRAGGLGDFFSSDVLRDSVGYLAACRAFDILGYEGLRALCVEAQKAPDEDAAAEIFAKVLGLDSNPDSWRAALSAELREEDLRWYAEQDASTLAAIVKRNCRSLFRDLDGETFLREVKPSLAVESTPWAVPIHDIPAFRTKLLELWGDNESLEPLFPSPAGDSDA